MTASSKFCRVALFLAANAGRTTSAVAAFGTPFPRARSKFSQKTTATAMLDHRGDDDGNGGADQAFGGGSSRRTVLEGCLLTAAAVVPWCSSLLVPQAAHGAAAAVQDSLDVDNFLRTGVDFGGNMGVSSQAGKSRPQTGVVLRDGSDVARDSRSGGVLAEILVGTKADPKAVLATFTSPWPLATGPVFDVECRDAKTGDGAFLAVSGNAGGKSVDDLPASFFLDRLFDPTGRFSFYGSPTDIKTEIPRNAIVAATIPTGTDNAVMLVGSATASRWRRGSEDAVRKTVESYRATPAPKSNLKMRAKDRGGSFAL